MPSPTAEQILAEYDAKISGYDEFRRITETLISQLLRHEAFRVHSVTSRLKSRQSLSGKISRDGARYSKLSDLTDIVGIRVITHFEDEVDRIGSLIEQEFQVDLDRSIDKRRILDPDRFGYLSLHYICGLTPARLELTENRSCQGLLCEIQVRSILQHAWAEIEHDLGYKAGAELPPHIRRRFSRLAGMLEIADAEFSRLRDDIESYGTQVATDIGRDASIVRIDAISLRTLLKKDPVIRDFDSQLASIHNVPLNKVDQHSGIGKSAPVCRHIDVAGSARRYRTQTCPSGRVLERHDQGRYVSQGFPARCVPVAIVSSDACGTRILCRNQGLGNFPDWRTFGAHQVRSRHRQGYRSIEAAEGGKFYAPKKSRAKAKTSMRSKHPKKAQPIRRVK